MVVISSLIFGRPVVKRFALCYRSLSVSPVPSVLSVTFVHCGQTVGRIKMPLGVEVGLSPGDFVIDGDSVLPSPKNGGRALLPNFRPISIVVKRLQYRCMHQDATWYGGRPQPRGLCVTWEPSPPLNFRPMFIIVIMISLEHCTKHSR